MDSLQRLTESLRCLPGIGPKSAQRIVHFLLHRHRSKGLHLAEALQEAMKKIKHCRQCQNYTETEYCAICRNVNRDRTLLCIVEGPADVMAIEQTHTYQGLYYVLMGKLSPLDGIGPQELNFAHLVEIIKNTSVTEVILALSPSIEGQTTVHFIAELLNSLSVRITQLAQGIPSGSELELLDVSTIHYALRNRSLLGSES
ncbi:MAG: recombination protein RecR [Legionellaceae bacterium]|nr:recombination protein RecR [Legionellaceae bacterium]HCA90006.1 recombination protein RecR [Legionellales bacterium]|tara:strand:- start:2759 stop:3358 length:600 start_codon:yes stop_codon:yes gene_type:complete